MTSEKEEKKANLQLQLPFSRIPRKEEQMEEPSSEGEKGVTAQGVLGLLRYTLTLSADNKHVSIVFEKDVTQIELDLSTSIEVLPSPLASNGYRKLLTIFYSIFNLNLVSQS